MTLTCIDTPGLHASSDAQAANRGLIKTIKRAWKAHKPNFLVYVDRCVRRVLGVDWVVAGCGCAASGRGELRASAAMLAPLTPQHCAPTTPRTPGWTPRAPPLARWAC
jgi:hypothetical protein